jgi:transposase-like protein
MSAEDAARALELWNECEDAREFACRVLAEVMNAMMDSEAQRMCGAGRNERSDCRTNSRNGYRDRTLRTAVGDVGLRIPKLREGSYFPEQMLARCSRVDVSVAAVVMEMYSCGVSTRKVERVAERLGISSLSSSEVSRLCDGLDREVEEMRTRDLSGMPCCYLWLDATYMRCRDGSSVVSKGLVTAIGLGADGRKHLLGADVVDTESEASWARFLGGLRDRGLTGVTLVISDDHAGLVAAVGRAFQGCAWQRCVTHLQRNLLSLASGRTDDQRRMVADLVHAACYQDDPDLAHLVWQRAEPWVSGVSRRAGEAFAAAEDSALAFMAFPQEHWQKIRTNNVQERANREIKRRYRVVQSFPSESSMLRLACSTLLELEGSWATHRTFSESLAAKGFEGPATRPPMSEGRRRALGRRAEQIVSEIAERYGEKKE